MEYDRKVKKKSFYLMLQKNDYLCAVHIHAHG